MESISTAELFLEKKQIYLLMSIFHPKVSNGQLKKFLEPPFVSDSSHSQEREKVVLGLLRLPFFKILSGP